MRRQRVEFRVQLQAETFYDEDAKVHVSYCPALDIYAQATSEVDAQRAMEGAILMFIKTCYARNTLDNVLNARGFKHAKSGGESTEEAINRISVRPVPRSIFDVDIDVPFELIEQMQRGSRTESVS